MSEVKDPIASNLDPALASMLELDREDDKVYLRCAACGHIITSDSERINIHERHEHHLTNPHGFQFHIGCFAQALGCDLSGQPQAADSWFMGYEWSIATCSNCQIHLGWLFTTVASTDFFYGLILERLARGQSHHDN